MFVTLTRVGPAPVHKVLGSYRVNPRHVVAVGPMQPEGVKYDTDDAEAQDGQGNSVSELLLSTGHSMYVLETPAEVSRILDYGAR